MNARVARLSARIARLPRPLLLAFDVDGTLAPIVDDPAAARVPPRTVFALGMLARVPGVQVALVTGRHASSLARVVRVTGAFRALEHGRVVVAPGEPARWRSLSPAERTRLLAFAHWARAHAAPFGVRLEPKPRSLGLHVRELARASPARARALLRDAGRRALAIGLVTRTGRGLLEAEIAHADKADALERLARTARARAVVYAGDDVTDAGAIRRARELGGVGVFVRSAERPRAPRGAGATLSGPQEVAELLSQLGASLSLEDRARTRPR